MKNGHFLAFANASFAKICLGMMKIYPFSDFEFYLLFLNEKMGLKKGIDETTYKENENLRILKKWVF